MRRPTTRTAINVGLFSKKSRRIKLYKSGLYDRFDQRLLNDMGEWEWLGEIKEIEIVPAKIHHPEFTRDGWKATAIIEVEAEVIEEDA